MKILLSNPTFESIEPDTFKSIYGLDRCGHTVLYNFTRGYDCAKARNEIAKETLAGGYDYVLMVDSDIVLPPDALRHLLDPAVDICLGVYPRKRTDTGQTELFRPGYLDFYAENNLSIQEIESCGEARMEIKGGGLGCALIRADVLRAIPFPWFSYVTYPDGTMKRWWATRAPRWPQQLPASSARMGTPVPRAQQAQRERRELQAPRGRRVPLVLLARLVRLGRPVRTQTLSAIRFQEPLAPQAMLRLRQSRLSQIMQTAQSLFGCQTARKKRVTLFFVFSTKIVLTPACPTFAQMAKLAFGRRKQRRQRGG